MQSRGARIGLVGGLVAVAVILFIVLNGSDNGSNSTTGTDVTTAGGKAEIQTIKLANGAPVGGIADLNFTKGDQVRFRVIPEPDVVEIHVHGYEIEKKTEGAKPVTMSFPANLDGKFEIEAHTTNDEFQIADLTVEPS
jgi:hypothetical protein